MPLSDDPSDCLAQLIEAARDWLAGLGDDAGASFAAALDEVRASGPVEAGEMRATEVMARGPVRAAAALHGTKLTTAAAAKMLHAIMILDEWHAPVSNDLSGEQWNLTPDHIERQTRLDIDGRFNQNSGFGSLIPRNGPDWRAQDDNEIRRRIAREYAGWEGQATAPTLASLLTYVSHLPAAIQASADNNDGDPHPVTVVYVRPPAADTPVDIVDPLVLTISPVLETPEEVSLTKHAERPAYIVTPSLIRERLEELVERAYRDNAGILLLPEMALCDDGLAALQEILAERSAAFLENEGVPPPLGWVLAGVASKREGHRNFVAVLTGSGEKIIEQDKFSRWNLNPEEQRQYELLADSEEGPDRLLECIEPATQVCVIDLPGLGRTVILICADMDVPEPGDWLYLNAGLDWIYAPIMDRSRPPQVPTEKRAWIVKRAFRAAELAQARVAVTNSMPLTAVINRSNVDRGKNRAPITTCHIGLLCEGHSAGVEARSVEVDLGERNVAVSCLWGDDWMEELRQPKGGGIP